MSRGRDRHKTVTVDMPWPLRSELVCSIERSEMTAYGALLPMGRRRHGEDGPSRFIAKGCMPQLPLSTHCWGPPGWLTRVESKGFSDDPGAKLARAP